MSGVEVFVVLAVAAFNLTVVSWSKRTNELVPYATLFEASLEQCEIAGFGCSRLFGEFKSVVGLDALYLERKGI